VQTTTAAETTTTGALTTTIQMPTTTGLNYNNLYYLFYLFKIRTIWVILGH